MPERIGSVAQLRSAYAGGSLTPADVAERVLAGLPSGAAGPVWISLDPGRAMVQTEVRQAVHGPRHGKIPG